MGKVVGAGGNGTQFKLPAQPPRFTDVETKTQQKCGVCQRPKALGARNKGIGPVLTLEELKP